MLATPWKGRERQHLLQKGIIGVRSQIWNNRGQITDFTNIAHLNQRVSKTLADGSVVHYHHDESGRLWSETDGQGNPLRDYVWMGDIPVAMVEYTGLTERVTYLHADHLNTPRYATDETGTLVWQWSSDAFGNGAPDEDPDGDGTAISLNLRFPGQYYDAESGLHYNWNRYYDPEIGRYITSDPIGLDGGINTFGYVENNPINLIDPLGLFSFPYYGNWCGPGWTGGQAGTWDDIKGSRNWKAPFDELDGCCMLHDICYSDCRNSTRCESEGQSACFQNCDRDLASCSNKSSTIYWGHKKSLNFHMSRSIPKAEECSCGK